MGETQRLLIKLEKLEQTVKEQDARIKQLEQGTQNQTIVPELDLTTASIGKATVAGLQITCNKGVNEYQPFFLTNRLNGRHTFEVEILTTNDNSYDYVGVAADTLRNTVGTYGNVDSLVLQLRPNDTYLWYGGKQSNLPKWPIQNGSRVRITVDRISQTVTWRLMQSICVGKYKAEIPKGMQDKNLLPVLYMYCGHGHVAKFV